MLNDTMTKHVRAIRTVGRCQLSQPRPAIQLPKPSHPPCDRDHHLLPQYPALSSWQNIEQQQSDVLQAVDRAFVQYHRGAELIACAFNYMDRELAPKSASEPQFPNYAEKPPLEVCRLL